MVYKLATGVQLARDGVRGTLLASEFDASFRLIPEAQRARVQQVYDLLRQRLGMYNLRHLRLFPQTIRVLDGWLEVYFQMLPRLVLQSLDVNIGVVLKDFKQQLSLETTIKEDDLA